MSWMAVVTPTDRPMLVCNHCVMRVFGCFCVLNWLFEFSVCIGAFVIELSQIFLFLSKFILNKIL